MLPLRLFRRRNFSFANLETLTVYAGLSTLTFFLVLFLQQIAGYSALRSGLALVPITVVMFFLSPARRPPLDAVRPAPLHGRRPADRRRSRCCRSIRLGRDLLLLDGAAARRCSSSRSASR